VVVVVAVRNTRIEVAGEANIHFEEAVPVSNSLVGPAEANAVAAVEVEAGRVNVGVLEENSDCMMVSRKSRSWLQMPHFPVPVRPGKLGGRLQEYYLNWEIITNDAWVLQTIWYGLSWEFKSRPPLGRHEAWRQAPRASSNLPAIRQKVADLLRIGAIERVQNVTTPGFYSRFFVVPKKQPGEWRAILDLKALNQFILIPKFKMETAHSIRRDLFHAQWTTSIDLIDAYMHVLIHPRYRHFLRFVVDDTMY
jgi:hypothetical protein